MMSRAHRLQAERDNYTQTEKITVLQSQIHLLGERANYTPTEEKKTNHRVAKSNPPPWSPGESPSRTQDPPSTQNGFESRKGPQKEPWCRIL